MAVIRTVDNLAFSAWPPLVDPPPPRAGILHLPFSAEDFDGVVYADA